MSLPTYLAHGAKTMCREESKYMSMCKVVDLLVCLFYVATYLSRHLNYKFCRRAVLTATTTTTSVWHIYCIRARFYVLLPWSKVEMWEWW